MWVKTSHGETDFTAAFSETCQQIRDRAADGYLEDAIKQLKGIIRSANTPARTECDMLSWRLAELEKNHLGGVLTADQVGVDRNKIAAQFFELTSKLQELPTQQSFDRALSPKEQKARREYLDAVKRDVASRLKVSIHQARLIDLGIEDTPSAVHLPWIYHDTSTSEEIENVDGAFDGYKRRLLILGSPGSGKTISQLYLAQKLIAEAEASHSAPLPLLVNLSKLDAEPSVKASSWPFRSQHEGVQRKGKRIEQWLTRELSAFPYVTSDMAATWVAEGRMAAFFDGLDEVDDGYRAQLVTLLNDTYLRDHPDSVVVVCSRINEYKPLQDDKATTLQVNGSVTLQPLTREQISDYLKKAGAEGLGTALRNDDTLYQIARTPLMLSMLTFAYSGSALPGIPSSGSFTERRHHLMHECVDRMLQRKARRDKGIQFDNNRQNDVPVKEYPFAPERLEHWLGWLAVRLSVRSQTAFSPRLLYSFLQRYSERDQRSGVWWTIAFARAPLVLIAALIGGLFSAPLELKAWCEVILLGLAGASAYLCVAGAAYAIDNEPAQTGWKGQFFRQIVQMILVGAFLTTVAVTAVGVASVTLSLALPGDIPPAPAGILAILIVVLLAITVIAVSNPFNYH
jgi:hypothetical protein